MQKYILSLVIFSFSIAIAGTQKTEILVDWECKAINYDSAVLKLPDRAKVKAQIKVKDDGRFEIKFKDNIFKDRLENRVVGFFESLFGGGDDDPTHTIDYANCISKFKDDFVQKLNEQYSSICSGNNCPTKEEIRLDFNNTLEDQKHIKKINQLPTVPRYYTGHDETYISSNLRDELFSYCENNEEVSTEIMTSKKFIELVANEVSRLNPKVDENCLTRIESELKKHNKFTNCSPENSYPCDRILAANENYSDEKLNFKENLEELLSLQAQEELQKNLEREKELLEKANYNTIKSPEEADAFRAELDTIIENYNNQYYQNSCNTYRAIKQNGYTEPIHRFDDAIQSNLAYIKENFPRPCLEDFLERYMVERLKKEAPSKSSFCQTFDCAVTRQREALFQDNYLGLIDHHFGDGATQVVCESIPEYDSEVSDIKSLLSNLNEVNQCSPLEPGEVKVVNDYNTTGVKMRYALKRETPQRLKANVVIDFKAQEGNTVTPDELLKKTQACLDVSSSYFTSPSGERMDVEVLSPDEAQSLPLNEKPALNTVRIGEAGMRSNSGEYAEDAGCGTITHEVLHLMGLCDEYEERLNGYYVDTSTGQIINNPTDDQKDDENVEWQTAYNQCRAISETPSIMSSHWRAMNLFIGRKSECKCKSGTSCETLMEQNDPVITNFIQREPFTMVNSFRNVCTYEQESSKTINANQLKDYDPVEIITRTDNELVYYARSFQLSSMQIASGRLYRYKVTCKCNNDSCRTEMNQLLKHNNDELNAISGTCVYPIMEPVVGGDKVNEYVNRDELKDNGAGGIEYNDGVITVTSPPKRKDSSLLHPAHFARIKYGSCKDKVKNYSQCAKYAYKRVASECPDRPAICDEDESWLLTEE